MTSASDRGLDTKNVRALVSGYGVGLFLGALLAIAVAGAGFMLFGALHALPLIIAVCAAIGLCDGLVWVGYVSFGAQIVPGEFLGRVSSVSQTLSMGLSPLGLMAAGVALDRVGGGGTLLGMGALSRASRGARVYGDEARRVNRQDAKEDAKDAKTRRVESGEKREECKTAETQRRRERRGDEDGNSSFAGFCGSAYLARSYQLLVLAVWMGRLNLLSNCLFDCNAERRVW